MADFFAGFGGQLTPDYPGMPLLILHAGLYHACKLQKGNGQLPVKGNMHDSFQNR